MSDFGQLSFAIHKQYEWDNDIKPLHALDFMHTFTVPISLTYFHSQHQPNCGFVSTGASPNLDLDIDANADVHAITQLSSNAVLPSDRLKTNMSVQLTGWLDGHTRGLVCCFDVDFHDAQGSQGQTRSLVEAEYGKDRIKDHLRDGRRVVHVQRFGFVKFDTATRSSNHVSLTNSDTVKEKEEESVVENEDGSEDVARRETNSDPGKERINSDVDVAGEIRAEFWCKESEPGTEVWVKLTVELDGQKGDERENEVDREWMAKWWRDGDGEGERGRDKATRYQEEVRLLRYF